MTPLVGTGVLDVLHEVAEGGKVSVFALAELVLEARAKAREGEIAGLEWVLNYAHPDEGGIFEPCLREDTYDAVMRRLDELRSIPDKGDTWCS